MTNTLIYQKNYRSFIFGSNVNLTEETLDRLISVFKSKSFREFSDTGNHQQTSMLNGRGNVKYITIPEAGDIVIKKYLRGGLLSYFNKNIYIKFIGKIRSQSEFEMLFRAEKAGINVPCPLAYASRGFLFYRTWLITKRINKCQNFAELSVKDEKRAIKLFPEIYNSIKKLIENRIYHVDLHPGNILIDAYDKNYIIDFDKALYFQGTTDRLGELYSKRWTRAVVKHKLPNFMLTPGFK